MNKGFAEARKEAREAVDKLRTEMHAGFAEAKEEREKGFAAAENRRFDAVETRVGRLEM